jgi:hypothetical protein
MLSIMAQGLSRKGMFQPRDTIILDTRDQNVDMWKGAATMVQQMVDELSTKKICVEIRNEVKMYRDVSTAITPNSAIHIACQAAEPIVHDEVKKSCPGLWTSISYSMRGPNDSVTRKATVIVSMAPGAKSVWGLVEAKIVKRLAHLDLAIELMPGRAMLLISQEMMPSQPFVLGDLPPMPVNGSSIGPRGCATQAGSVGAFVNFRVNGKADEKCILTCFHVIADENSTYRRTLDSEGIGLNGRQVDIDIIIDYPAPLDAVMTARVLQQDISQGNDTDGTKADTLHVINRHVAAGGIGKVIHASGLCTNRNGHRMDWAIVRLHDQKSTQENKPPPANFSLPELFNGRLTYKVGADEVVLRCGTLDNGHWASKIGRTTDVTAGEVNAMSITVHWANGTESKEISVVSAIAAAPFAHNGDSGAMVFNLQKEWVGMVIGKLSHDDVVYVTLVQELIDDIREKTGGIIFLA